MKNNNALDLSTFLARVLDALNQGDLHRAQTLCGQLIKRFPKASEAWTARGMVERRLGRDDAAIAAYRTAVRLHAGNADAYNNLGNLYKSRKDWPEAARAFRQAVAARPAWLAARLSAAEACRLAGDLGGTRAVLAETLQQFPEHAPVWVQMGHLCLAESDAAGAMVAWDRALQLDPDDPNALINRAQQRESSGLREAAIADYERVLQTHPELAAVHNNLGSLYVSLQRHQEAALSYQRAIDLGLRLPVVLKNQGMLLTYLRRVADAIPLLDAYLESVPEDANVLSSVTLSKLKLCRWDIIPSLRERLLLPVLQGHVFGGEPALPFPFLVLPLEISEAEQLVLAKAFARYIESRTIVDRFAVRGRRLGTSGRLRLGYLSADFHNHATAHLMMGVFKRHDRARFEIFAYSLGENDGSHYRQRIMAEVDHFVDLRLLDDTSAAERIHADSIDILIDLKGYTQQSRAEIVAQRPAPIQVQYLGYPGSMGAEFIDYLITDRVVSPPSVQVHYTEQLAFLPHCYQVNDDEQAISRAVPTRAECGLPERGLVFCCFCAHYKIEPVIFGVWMELLRRVPDGVLWLIEGSEEGRENLCRSAREQGIDAGRLVFAPHVPKDQHLARHIHADLFLDTYFCNGHTTASDALWAGVPVLTCPGETFARRVCASLLSAMGLPELIATSLDHYAALAIGLAQDPAGLKALKSKVSAQRACSPLFDTRRFVRDFESLLAGLAEDYAKRYRHPVMAPKQEPAVTESVLAMLGAAWQACQSGQLDQASLLTDQAYAIDPGHATLWVLRGIIAKRRGDMPAAESAYLRATEVNPDDADAWFNLGNLLRLLGRSEEAISAMRRAGACRPDWDGPWLVLSELSREQNDAPGALAAAQRATNIAPTNVEAWNNLGSALLALGRHDEALAAYQRGLGINAKHLGCLINSALAEEQRGHLGSALAWLADALAIEPDNRMASLVRGRCFRSQGQLAMARKAFLDWLARHPEDAPVRLHVAEVANDLAVKAMQQCRPLSAKACIDEALTWVADSATFHFNRALILLHLGEYQDGFSEYQWRLKLPHIPPHKSRHTLWQGEDISGKTVLLYGEQGYGDALQFLRFAELLKDRGARVVLEVQAGLKALLADLPWADAVVAEGDAYPPGIEYKASLLSLPHWLQIDLNSLPARIPYLHAPVDRVIHWQKRLGERRALRVGMVWAGSPTNATEHLRAPGLNWLRRLWESRGVDFFLLQKGGGRKELDGLSLPENVRDLGDEISDFADTAAIMSLLDVVISSDTSTAHLAGALGKPLWAALYYGADWRWIEVEGRSVWYPNAILFRQRKPGDWASVVANMGVALEAYLEKEAAAHPVPII